MIGLLRLPHTLVVTSPGRTKDRYNNEVLTYDAESATTVTISGFMQPRKAVMGKSSGSEDTTDRDAATYEFDVFTDQPLGFQDRVTWEGRTFEVNGPSHRWDTPYGPHHYETDLRVTEG